MTTSPEKTTLAPPRFEQHEGQDKLPLGKELPCLLPGVPPGAPPMRTPRVALASLPGPTGSCLCLVTTLAQARPKPFISPQFSLIIVGIIFLKEELYENLR